MGSKWVIITWDFEMKSVIKIKTDFLSYGGRTPLLLTKCRFAEISISVKFVFTGQKKL